LNPPCDQGRACLAVVAGGLGLLRGRPTGHPGDHRASHPCRAGRGCRLHAGLPARLRHHQASAEPAPAGRCRWPSTSATSSCSPYGRRRPPAASPCRCCSCPTGGCHRAAGGWGGDCRGGPGHGDGGQRPDAGASREALVDNPLPLGGVAGRLAGVPALELRRWPRSSGRVATAAHTAAPGPHHHPPTSPSGLHTKVTMQRRLRAACARGIHEDAQGASAADRPGMAAARRQTEAASVASAHPGDGRERRVSPSHGPAVVAGWRPEVPVVPAGCRTPRPGPPARSAARWPAPH
jgi:hypothetical protein